MPDEPGADDSTVTGKAQTAAAGPTVVPPRRPSRKSKWALSPAPDEDEDGRGDQGDETTEPIGPEGHDQASGFRIAAIGALLIVVLFAGYGLGRLNDSGATATPAATASTGTGTGVVNENMPHTHSATGSGLTTTAGAAVGGLSLSSGGVTLHPATTTFQAGKKQRFSFTINGPGGAPVTSYAIVHDKPLHLIVIRRDLTGFQHLHPEMAADGTWSIDLTLAQPGVYRMITDFSALVGGQQVTTTLGSDLTVAGDYTPSALPEPTPRATTAGYTVTYAGTAGTQAIQPLLMTVTGADGKPATVEPYLGAYGHLVVMRQGDLAYVHVHPEQQLVDGQVKFWITAPSPGDYRMFFDFQVAGQVHTAEWTLKVS